MTIAKSAFLDSVRPKLNDLKAKVFVLFGTLRVRFLMLSRPAKIALIVAAVGLVGFILMPGKVVKVKPLGVQSITNYKDQISVMGKVRPSAEYFLSLNRGGKIDKILVKEGDLVSEGQTLAIVDEAVRTMGLKSALSAFRLASRDMARIQSLLNQGAATPQEVDETRARFDLRRSELENAKTLLSDGVIRSPVNGRLSVFVFQVGDRIPDGSRVGVVQKTDDFEAIAKFPYERKGELIGTRDVVLVLDEKTRKTRGLSQEQGTFAMKAELVQISQESDFDGENVDLRIRMGALPEGLRAGDSVEVTVVAKEIPEVKTVSASAIKWRDQKPFLLFHEKNNALSWRAVKVGTEVQGRIPIWGIDSFEGFVESEKTAQDLDLLIKKQSKAKILE
ncbi:MAG: efflux RND transporter periplasmic adaptor subunit [Bdellovibrionales bacterium]|nr:efflux RND transporter periplasmic adaptor subunit [Bdellovibrionales bacterium]